MTLIYSIHKRDEPPRQISFPKSHPRHIRYNKRVITLAQLQIVGCALSLPNQIIKCKPRSPAARFRYLDISSPHSLDGFMGRVIFYIPQETKPLLGVRDGGFVKRMMVDT